MSSLVILFLVFSFSLYSRIRISLQCSRQSEIHLFSWKAPPVRRYCTLPLLEILHSKSFSQLLKLFNFAVLQTRRLEPSTTDWQTKIQELRHLVHAWECLQVQRQTRTYRPSTSHFNSCHRHKNLKFQVFFIVFLLLTALKPLANCSTPSVFTPLLFLHLKLPLKNCQ